MEEQLRSVLMQLQRQYQDAQRQLQIVTQQSAGKERDKKLHTLTLREIEALPKGEAEEGGATLYKSVGRMFLYETREGVEKSLADKVKLNSDEIVALEKKAKHFQSEMSTAQGSLRDLLQQERP